VPINDPLIQLAYLVFANRSGHPLEPRTIQQEFKATLKAASLPDMRLHDLRHCTASFLINAGADLRLIMEQLGHSTIKLTSDTYGHIARKLLDDNATRMDTILSSRT
jgi:site-specific recombinase XerD